MAVTAPLRTSLAVAAVAAAITVLPAVASAGERVTDAALGALSGALVGGPVGLVAGGVIGYTAGSHIARGMGLKHRHYDRDRTAYDRRASHRAALSGAVGASPRATPALARTSSFSRHRGRLKFLSLCRDLLPPFPIGS